MLFEFNVYSGLLLPFVLAGGLASGWLVGRALFRRTAPDALLALLLLLPTLALSERMLHYAGWATDATYMRWRPYLPWHLGLAVGPAYYLYFRSLTNQEFRWRAQCWHLLPALLRIAASGTAALTDWLLHGSPRLGAVVLQTLSRPISFLGYILLLIYIIRMLTDYRRYRHYLDDNFSNQERLRFDGLRQLLVLQLLGLAVSVVFTGLDAMFGFSSNVGWLAFFLRGGLIYGLLVVGIESNYAAATNPLRFLAERSGEADTLAALPHSESAALPPVPTSPNAAAPVAVMTPNAVGLSAELLSWRDKLLYQMDTQHPWLEPDLNLTELARRVGLHSAVLSKVINAGCGQNFNDFVNTYRVAEVQRKLADPHFAHYSLLGIALDSGFNSKSTFTRAFKKLTGELPSEVMRVNL